MKYKYFSYALNFLLITISISCTNKSEDSWNKISIPEIDNYLISSVYFLENKGMFITNLRGNSGIYLTTDGGSTWEVAYDGEEGLHDIKMKNDTTALAVGNSGILRTNDAGVNWKAIDINITEPLMAIDFSSEKRGLAVGRNGTIIYTANGGEIWEKQESESSSFLRDVTFLDENTAYTVGSGGTILKTVNAGQSWTTLTVNYEGNLSAVHFVDSKKGIAAGGNGTILHTTDGGTTWSRVKSETNKGLLGVDFYEKNGIIVGFGGTILESDDGGKTWKLNKKGEAHLYDVKMVGPGSSILVGDQGTVLKK